VDKLIDLLVMILVVLLRAVLCEEPLLQLAGDKLKIGNELKMIVADATANGSGVISLTVEPPFRATYADSTAIVWDKPTALFLLTSNEWKADIDPPARAHFAIDGLEVFS
jgi:hypothetical protein